MTPLHYAAQSKSAQAPALVEGLLDAEAEVNAATDMVSAWDGGVVWDGMYVRVLLWCVQFLVGVCMCVWVCAGVKKGMRVRV